MTATRDAHGAYETAQDAAPAARPHGMSHESPTPPPASARPATDLLLAALLALLALLALSTVPGPARADERTDAAKEAAAKDRAALKKARAEADSCIRQGGLASTDAKREEARLRFDALDVRARIPSLLEALGPERHEGSQRFAVARLKALAIPEVVPHLVLLATAPGARRPARDDAHAAAAALHAQATRAWTERVVANDVGKRRILAIGRLAEIRAAESVPLLAKVVASVGLEVHLQVAQLENLASVPVNLGSVGAAATQVPIQLPTISLIDVHVNAMVPAEIQVVTRAEALRALRTIAGNLGEDPAHYVAWHAEWKAKQDAAAKAAEATPAAPK